MSQPITILFSEESHGGGGVLNMDSDGTQLSQECAALSICTPEDTNSFPIIPPPNPHLSKPQKRNKRTRQSRKGYMSPLEDDFKDIPTTCVKKKNKRVPTRLVSPCRGPDFMMYPSPPRSAPFAIVTREMSELSRSSSIMSDGLDRSPKSGSKLAIYTTEFSEHVEIGHGCFGRVMRVRKKTDGMTYAIKISWTPIRGERDQEARLHEVHALAKCDHPNILRYFSSWIEEGFVYLQTEYCAGGCASKKLSSFWSQHNTLQLLMQLSSALEYLHQHKLAHMDVKGENIYLTAKGIYKLGDFGLVAFLDTKQPLEQGLSRNRSLLFSQDSCEGLPRNRSLLFSQDSCASQEEGDKKYLAPELLNDKNNLPAADIFSLGISIYELCIGQELPGSGEEWHMLRQGQLAPIPQLTSDLQDLIARMMSYDPKFRPSATEVRAACENMTCTLMS